MTSTDFDFQPIWAERFNFNAHSPSGANRPNDKEFFEKVIARPAKLYDFAGCAATAGRVCEQYAKDIVMHDMPGGEAFSHCVASFDEHRVLEHDADDASKHSMIRDAVYTVPKSCPPETGTVLELTARHTADALREATSTANQITNGRWVSARLEGTELPHIGEIDVEAMGGVVEIKTRWPTLKPESKNGFTVRSLPTKPDAAHVQQVALYWHWLSKQSDNVPVRLLYANCIGYRVFSSEDCPELAPARLNEALENLARVARTRENLMRTAETVPELLALVAPDFSHWMWKNVPPAYRAAAEQAWSEA